MINNKIVDNLLQDSEERFEFHSVIFQYFFHNFSNDAIDNLIKEAIDKIKESSNMERDCLRFISIMIDANKSNLIPYFLAPMLNGKYLSLQILARVLFEIEQRVAAINDPLLITVLKLNTSSSISLKNLAYELQLAFDLKDDFSSPQRFIDSLIESLGQNNYPGFTQFILNYLFLIAYAEKEFAISDYIYGKLSPATNIIIQDKKVNIDEYIDLKSPDDPLQKLAHFNAIYFYLFKNNQDNNAIDYFKKYLDKTIPFWKDNELIKQLRADLKWFIAEVLNTPEDSQAYDKMVDKLFESSNGFSQNNEIAYSLIKQLIKDDKLSTLQFIMKKRKDLSFFELHKKIQKHEDDRYVDILTLAVGLNRLPIAQHLIETESFPCEISNEYDYLLNTAIRSGSLTMVRYVVENLGYAVDKDHKNIINSLFLEAIEQWQKNDSSGFEIIEYLLEKGVNPNLTHGVTIHPLFRALDYHGNKYIEHRNLIALLAKYGIDLFASDSQHDNCGALHHAANLANYPLMEYLLNNKLDCNAGTKNDPECTPLSCLLTVRPGFDRFECMLLLFSRGVDLFTLVDDNTNIITHLFENRKQEKITLNTLFRGLKIFMECEWNLRVNSGKVMIELIEYRNNLKKEVSEANSIKLNIIDFSLKCIYLFAKESGKNNICGYIVSHTQDLNANSYSGKNLANATLDDPFSTYVLSYFNKPNKGCFFAEADPDSTQQWKNNMSIVQMLNNTEQNSAFPLGLG